VKRIYRYLLGTRKLALTFGAGKKGLEGFTDADGASQEHQHAISGYAYILDRGAVSWASKKQELVTLSTTEAEYIAATHAAKEGIWLRRLVEEVFRPLAHPTPLHSDSQSAIALLDYFIVPLRTWLPIPLQKLYLVSRRSISLPPSDYAAFEGECWTVQMRYVT